METPPTLRPLVTRQQSRVPGGFDETDDENSPVKSNSDEALTANNFSPNLTNDSSSPQHRAEGKDVRLEDGSIVLDEKEMTRQLQDVESSFMPEQSPLVQQRGKYRSEEQEPDSSFSHDNDYTSQTPYSTYKTPAARRDASSPPGPFENTEHANTSMLETMSSSPTAAAAARTVSRVVSMASMEGYETAVEGPNREDSTRAKDLDGEPTPTKRTALVERTDDNTPTPRMSPSRDQNSLKTPRGSRRRPKYLNSRHASQRSSYSSNTTSTSAEGSSDLSMGAEYALQTGGGTPLQSSSAGRPNEALSRSISLGSVASGISKFDDDEDSGRAIAIDLDTLQEEGSPQSSILTTRQDSAKDTGPQTPRASVFTPETLTDTVINQHVKNFEIPGTIARSFLSRDVVDRSVSPDKRSSLATPSAGRVKNLTLKEQSGLIDKLQKENWKLKLRVYFMDQMLNERSDEAVKAMISENVELKTFKFSATKEIRGQKRLIKELEAKLKEREERLASQNSTIQSSLRRSSHAEQPGQSFELETEVSYLRERIESYQSDIERLRADNAVKEGEKRRLAEMVRSAGDRSALGSDLETKEEVAVWKDLLEAETGRREQTEEENRRLQEELWRLKAQGASTSTGQPRAPPFRTGKRRSVSEVGSDLNGLSNSSFTLVEHLRQENAELRRDLGAQTSMLTSRNREKEKLYQEIEELKIFQRRDGRRSVGESILERSISRAHGRSASRTSSQTRATQIGDPEREAYETANGGLRDRIAELKLENQELADHLDNVLDELENITKTQEDFDSLKKMYDELTEQTNQELLSMQSERDEALQLQEEADLSFQDLRAEAQERINSLEDELDQNTETIKQLEQELTQRDEESKALRNEVRMTSEGLDKVEADVQAKIRRIKELELENEDINRELENIENSLIEANGKTEKLSIELESRQSECAFLREEQDGFVLKIGDLETAMKGAQTSLRSEKDRAKDLDARLAEERQQRELVGSKEKQEVQKMINDLNREATNAKDETRNLKKDLETRENEIGKWKDRLSELEQGLQEILGEKKGSRTNYVFAISEMQRSLEETVVELTTTQTSLAEKDRILKKRDALLESHGLEARKLSELLEKERSARRTDRAQQEQWQKTSQHSSRTISQKDSRITELEQSRQSDRKRMGVLEQQFKEQMTDRNKLLLDLWNKLSVLCGSDWVNQNSLVNNHLPTVDVISNMLPGFQKNLLLAVKTIESVVGNFPRRIKNVEAALMKDYQQLEHNLDLRIRRLDRLESSIQQGRVSGVANAAPEIAKLRGENRLLKSELADLQKQAQVRQSRHNAVSIEQASSGSSPGKGPKDNATKAARAAAASMLTRHYSSTTAETIQRGQQTGRPASDSLVAQSQPIEPSQARWIHRLKDLERRLKAEREARLQDRKGARERLEEGRAEYEELRLELEREKERNKGWEKDYEDAEKESQDGLLENDG